MSKLTHLTATSLALVLAASATAPLFAEEAVTEETIIVTGSRIGRTTFDSPSPVTNLDSAQIEAVGTTNVGEFLSRIPQTVAQQTASSDVFASTSGGLQLTALRNLGSERTLTLVNGRRFVSGVSPGIGYGVDLNSIPVGIVDRIEILTGGASAVYGSDAIAGVVNVITKTDFEGVEINTQGSVPEEGERNKRDVEVTIGANHDRGNVWASFTWSEDEGLDARDRDFSATDLAYVGGTGNVYFPSSFSPQGRIGPYNGDGTPRNLTGVPATDDRFNRASRRVLATPVNRRLAAAGATYDISDTVHSSFELTATEVDIKAEYEPFPLDLIDSVWDLDRGGTGGLDVATSPLLPELLRQNLLNDGVTNLNQLPINQTARRITEFGSRSSDIDRTIFRVGGAIVWDVSDTMSLDTSVVWGRTDVQQQDNVGINRERAAFALDAEVDPDDATGQTLRCVNATARFNGCVPLNIFGANTISQGAVQYLKTPQNLDSEVEQLVVSTTLNGDLPFFELPGGIAGFAVGLEYREEKGSEIPDASAQAGITTSNRILPTNGDFDVKEAFAELRLPFADWFIMDASYRIGDYSTVDTVDTWKVGAEVPLFEQQLRLRGTVSTSVRAPNVADLFAGSGETFAPLSDACNGITDADTGNIAVNCRSVAAIQQRITDTGAFTLSQVEQQSTGGFQTGNPDVTEETADAWTLGVVWQPSFAEGLNVAVDYYNIEVEDAITLVDRSITVQRCYEIDPAVFDPACAGKTIRDPATGALTQVNTATSNEENYYTSGVDVELSYSMDLRETASWLAGGLDVALLYTWLEEFEIETIVGGDINIEDGEVEYPEHRVNMQLTYVLDQFSANYRVSYMSQTVDSNEPGIENFDAGTGGAMPNAGNNCAARFYHDARFVYDWSEALTGYFGINNLLDEHPCTLAQTTKYGDIGINTNGSMYDLTGREFYLGVRVKL